MRQFKKSFVLNRVAGVSVRKQLKGDDWERKASGAIKETIESKVIRWRARINASVVMFAKSKSSGSTPSVLLPTPLQNLYEVGKQAATAGPENAWRIYDGYTKTDRKVRIFHFSFLIILPIFSSLSFTYHLFMRFLYFSSTKGRSISFTNQSERRPWRKF